MRKILLVVEEFNERVYLETLLKKVGWDVISLGSPQGLGEKIISFSPDLLIISGKSKLDGVDIAKRARRQRPAVKNLLLDTKMAHQKVDVWIDAGIDGAIDSPISHKVLFESLELMGGFPASQCLQKLNSIRKELEQQFEKYVENKSKPVEELEKAVGKKASSETAPATKKKAKKSYDQVLADLSDIPEQTTLDRKYIRSAIEKIRREIPYDQEAEKLDQERQDFLKALFKAGKK